MRHTEDLLLERLKEKQAQQQQQEQQQEEESLDLSVLHVQFEVLMAATRPVMQILTERQARGCSDAYLRTLEQLREQYCAMRLRLLLPSLKKHLQGALRFLLESLATATYDELFPAVLACSSVEELCDIRETLLLEIAAAQEASADASPLLQKLYQLTIDVQERLFFRLEVTVDAEISRYAVNPQELSKEWILQQTYPPVRRALHLVLLLLQRSSRSRESGGSSAAAAAGDPFDAACSDVLAACLVSLDAAARSVGAARLPLFSEPTGKAACAAATLPAALSAPPSNVEVSLMVSLFLIKNLTLLHDILSSYESRFVRSERQLAFPGVAGSFFQLLRLAGAAAPRNTASAGTAPSIPADEGFFAFLLPRVSETTFNAAAAIHEMLATACNDFVAAAVALKTLRERLEAFAAASRAVLPPLVGLLLPALTPEYFSEEGALLFTGAAGRGSQTSQEEEALTNVDFLLRPVVEGILSKIREVDDLLQKEAKLDSATLLAVGWSLDYAEKEKEIRELVREAAYEAFAAAKRHSAAEKLGQLESLPAPQSGVGEAAETLCRPSES
ncbi:uncharacterized protein LOC34618877 [Cyclospora cayetanensis]|uniref:Uncharacterized protein LOC34618877 n=1 Tax=Cyclospora cayetanensis TaxID=88456 RepID=A0A6P6RRL9_9EIME|nr:uncharacterized protein LOC34618877 [Cyclospora cayetanensis]